jgi:hypothetical protein
MGPMMKDISHPVYNGRELAGTVEALEHGGFIALDGNGKRLGAYQSRLEAVRAVLDAARDAALLAEVEARTKESNR